MFKCLYWIYITPLLNEHVICLYLRLFMTISCRNPGKSKEFAYLCSCTHTHTHTHTHRFFHISHQISLMWTSALKTSLALYKPSLWRDTFTMIPYYSLLYLLWCSLLNIKYPCSDNWHVHLSPLIKSQLACQGIGLIRCNRGLMNCPRFKASTHTIFRHIFSHNSTCADTGPKTAFMFCICLSTFN